MPPLAPKAAKTVAATAQDFRFLPAAPAKTPAIEPRNPTESGIVTRVMPPPDAKVPVKPVRTVRVAPSARPRLDATVVAKKRIPKPPK